MKECIFCSGEEIVDYYNALELEKQWKEHQYHAQKNLNKKATKTMTTLKQQRDKDMEVAEFAVLFDRFAECLPKSVERSIIGDKKLAEALTIAYLEFRPVLEKRLRINIAKGEIEYWTEILNRVRAKENKLESDNWTINSALCGIEYWQDKLKSLTKE